MIKLRKKINWSRKTGQGKIGTSINKKQPLWRLIYPQKRPYLLLSISFHICLLIIIILVGISFDQKKPVSIITVNTSPNKHIKEPSIVKASMIPSSEIKAEEQRIDQKAQKKQAVIREKKLQKQIELAAAKARIAKAKAKAQQRAKQLRIKKLAAQKIANEKAQKIAAAKKATQLKKIAKEKAQKKQAEKKAIQLRRKQEIAKKRALAKAQAIAKDQEQNRKKAAENLRKMALSGISQQRDKEKAQSLAAANVQKVNSEIEKYTAIIRQIITANWTNSFAKSGKDLSTTVRVRLNAQGDIVSLNIVKSSGNRQFDNQLILAIRRSTPLPLPKEQSVREKLLDVNYVFNNI